MAMRALVVEAMAATTIAWVDAGFRIGKLHAEAVAFCTSGKN